MRLLGVVVRGDLRESMAKGKRRRVRVARFSWRL